MYYFKKLLTAIAIAIVVIVALTVSNHYLGQMWTEAILLILLLITVVFGMQIRDSKKREISVKIEKDDVNTRDVLEYLDKMGSSADMDYIKKFKPESEQPTYAQLTPAQQVMKSEEGAIRARVAETIRFRDSDAFKSWGADKQVPLLDQLGAMVLYHWCLLARCEREGVLLWVDSSDSSDGSSSDSSSSSGSSTDSSSSDSSSSSDGSSSDSSDSSSSSSSSSSNNEKPQPKK